MAKFNEKNFKPSEMHVNSIDEFINDDEEILWKDKPKKSAFIWSKILNMLPIVLIWMALDGFIIYMMIAGNILSEMPVVFSIFIILFFVIHLTPVWIWLGNVLTAAAQHKNTEYIFTNERIIIKTGVIIDIENIYYMDIISVNLKVGLIDKLLKVGDVYILSKFKSTVLNDLTDPYRVVNFLQKIVNDIKTDMYYPNDLRPEENKGYKTKYKYEDNNNNKKP